MAARPELVERLAGAEIVLPIKLPQAKSSESDPSDDPSEEALAREWVELHGERWRFDHTAGKWFRWNDARWERDDRKQALHLIGEHLREASKRGKRPKPSVASRKTASGVEGFAQANPAVAVTHEAWDSDLLLLGTPGGTVDLRTGKLRPADPRDHITKQASVAPADGEPTRFLRFLRETVGDDEEMLAFLQLWAGYCLTGLTNAHALLFIYGPGGNGKSVFLNTITGILADYAVTAAMETFTASRNERHSTELAMLAGARLVTASETEQGKGWAEAKLKAMTGGDPITARFMRQDNFTFTPHFKLMVAGNYAPSVRNVDEAMRRRLYIVPFTRTPRAPDRELEEKLRGEWPQILAWMIEGCRLWQAQGLTRPEAVQQATEGYFADQDVFGQWIEECCERDPTERKWEQPARLFRSWKDYAAEAGEAAGTNRDFKVALERRGIRWAKSNGLRIYRGVTLRLEQGRRDG
ncbi:MAG: hypothetical protein KGM83_11310 [Betaproteobacteria bacterium]|nr:hypothetical protein [Betaproteobacteria bacterium]